MESTSITLQTPLRLCGDLRRNKQQVIFIIILRIVFSGAASISNMIFILFYGTVYFSFLLQDGSLSVKLENQ